MGNTCSGDSDNNNSDMLNIKLNDDLLIDTYISLYLNSILFSY